MTYYITLLSRITDLRDSELHLPILSVWAVKFAHKVMVWDQNYKSRCALKRLAEQGRIDIGKTQMQIDVELKKYFWER